MHGSQAAWQTFQHGRWNITFSLTWQRRSFSFPLPVWLYSMIILLGSLKIFFGDQLTFKDHIVKTARSCRFALHNIRRIGPFQTEYAAQLLAQALVTSRLGYCNSLLAGTSIMGNQTSTNGSEYSGTTGLPKAQKTPFHTSLYLPALGTSCGLVSSSRHWCLRTEQPEAQHPILPPHSYEATSPSEAWDLKVSDALW